MNRQMTTRKGTRAIEPRDTNPTFQIFKNRSPLWPCGGPLPVDSHRLAEGFGMEESLWPNQCDVTSAHLVSWTHSTSTPR
jgi:hypothetical protein